MMNQLNWEMIDMFMNDFMNDVELLNIFNSHGDEPSLRDLSNDYYRYNNKYDFRLCDMAYIVNHLEATF